MLAEIFARNFLFLIHFLCHSCRTYFRFPKWGSLNSIALRIRVNSVNMKRKMWWFRKLTFSAGAISTKYVGLFIYLYVGLHTILKLWTLLGDTTSSIVDFVKYFAANFICLILGIIYCTVTRR
jgi:dolichyl-phosphate-mannose--protein O-mannosyl transferase